MSKELYKKYRPKEFSEVYGNSGTKQALESYLNENELPHSILFYGPSGCGKTTLARIVVDELGCNPIDVNEINVADYRGIDTIREIISKMGHKPMAGKFKAYILDEAHMLSNDAQNALLKPLEDTPNHVYFILCTTRPEKLISTVRGRCCSFSVEPLPENEILKLLQKVCEKEEVKIDKDLLEQISENCGNGPRTALVILDKLIAAQSEGEDTPIDVLRMLGEITECIDLCRALVSPGTSWRKISEILKGLERGEAERYRRAILGYMCSIVLSGGKKADMASEMIYLFEDHIYDSGFPGLVNRCYRACKGS